MAYEEKQKNSRKTHSVILENREKLSVSGVEDVSSFDENEVSMLTTEGSLIVRGSGLKVGRLSLDSGDVTLEGLVTELCYEEVAQSRSLWARLFH